MQNIIKLLSNRKILTPVSCANTAAATSGWIDAKGYEGLFLIQILIGTIVGTVTFTFEEASDGSGTGGAAMTPVEGNPAAITTSTDDEHYNFTFDARTPRSHIRVIGTIVTGPALLGYNILGIRKY